jgi:hypothetical protein
MSRPGNTYITIRGQIGRETDKAIQFTVQAIGNDDIEEEPTEWFPLSQVEKIWRNKGTTPDEMQVSEWILKAKGLI